VKAKKITSFKKTKLIILLGMFLLVATWFLYKNSNSIVKTEIFYNFPSKSPTLPKTSVVDASSWKEYRSEWSTNISNIAEEDPYITHYLKFEVTSKIPDGWVIGDNSYFFNNDQTTWVWKEGPHTRPGLVPSQNIKIESIAFSDTTDIYSGYPNSFVRIFDGGIVAQVSSSSNIGVESEIIRLLKIKLLSSKCLNNKVSTNHYDCPAPKNVSFRSIR